MTRSGLPFPSYGRCFQAATEAEADSLLVRVEKGAGPGPVEAWLFSEPAEGIVGMIEVGEAGAIADLDE